MQTFLTYASFRDTAKALDKKRLFKQLVEARQILATIGINVYKNDGVLYRPTHRNHPAIKMWRNYSKALMLYHNMILEECIDRGIKTQITPFNIDTTIVYPPWLGDTNFHNSHKSNLLKKDYDFYKKYNWNVPTNLAYIWPNS